MLTLTPAQLSINEDGIPYSAEYKDNYFSIAGPREECEHVFIHGNNITQRWNSPSSFTIAELGFGFGLNFLTTANTWINDNNTTGLLHYISIEKHPIQRADLLKFYVKHSINSYVQKTLFEDYPPPITGQHRIHFHEQNITLTLIFENALTALTNADFSAHAWFLDGFSPNKNESMWTKDIADQVYRLTHATGSFSTYTTAATVKENFSVAGFRISKKTGFATKREMLYGEKSDQPQTDQYSLKQKSWLLTPNNQLSNKKVIVIGGGLAGTMISAALAKRKCQVTLIEQHNSLAAEGSGNANAILMPRLTVDHDLQAQLTLLGYYYSIRELNNLNQYAENKIWQQCGAIQIPRDEEQWQRMQLIAQQEKLPQEFLREITSMQASELASCKLNHAAWYFADAGWAVPKNICLTLLDKYQSHITLRSNTAIKEIVQEHQQWHVLDKNSAHIENAEVVIIANAFNANQFEQTTWCPLHAKRGQLTYIPNSSTNLNLDKIICSDAYITPPTNNNFIVGATFISNDSHTDLRDAEHLENINKIKNLLPNISINHAKPFAGRAAIRAVSPDRLPIVGAVAKQKEFFNDYRSAALGATNISYSTPQYYKGLYLATGFGSRGMAWIPLCAEALACMVTDEPSPLNRPLLDAIHPNRFLMKQLIRSVQ